MKNIFAVILLFFLLISCNSETKKNEDATRKVANSINNKWEIKPFKNFPNGYVLDSVFYNGPVYHRNENNDTINHDINIESKVYYPLIVNDSNSVISSIVRMDLSSNPEWFSWGEIPDGITTIYLDIWVDDFFASEKFISFRCIEQYHSNINEFYFHGFNGFNFTLKDKSSFYFKRMLINENRDLLKICDLANKYKKNEHSLIPDDIEKYQQFYIKKDSLILLFDHIKMPNREFTICEEEFFIGSYSIPLDKLKPFIKSEYNFIFE